MEENGPSDESQYYWTGPLPSTALPEDAIDAIDAIDNWSPPSSIQPTGTSVKAQVARQKTFPVCWK